MLHSVSPSLSLWQLFLFSPLSPFPSLYTLLLRCALAPLYQVYTQTYKGKQRLVGDALERDPRYRSIPKEHLLGSVQVLLSLPAIYTRLTDLSTFVKIIVVVVHSAKRNPLLSSPVPAHTDTHTHTPTSLSYPFFILDVSSYSYPPHHLFEYSIYINLQSCAGRP